MHPGARPLGQYSSQGHICGFTNDIDPTRRCCGLVAALILNSTAARGTEVVSPRVIQNVPIYAVPGHFGGWPANHGIWIWGNEIVVGFSAGDYKDLGPKRHAIDRQKPEYHLLARSLDGGQSWSIEDPGKQGVLIGTRGMRHGTLPPGVSEKEPVDCPGGIDFTHPDFAMTVRMGDVDGVADSRFYYSTDRAHTWKGPFRLPRCGQIGLAARTDYLVNGPHDCMLFVTASKKDHREGRVVCLRTTDGGKSFQFVSEIGPEPTGYAIMPSTVRLSPTDILTTIRRHEKDDAWIDAYLSQDNARTWRFLNRAAPDLGEGNPPALIRLRDGRLCLTYGTRKMPSGIQARVSSDGGNSWSEPIKLRTDAGGRDLGYPRTVQRPDGRIVTVYYFQDNAHVEAHDPGDDLGSRNVGAVTKSGSNAGALADTFRPGKTSWQADAGLTRLRRLGCTRGDHQLATCLQCMMSVRFGHDPDNCLAGCDPAMGRDDLRIDPRCAGCRRDRRQIVLTRLVLIERADVTLELLAFLESQFGGQIEIDLET